MSHLRKIRPTTKHLLIAFNPNVNWYAGWPDGDWIPAIPFMALMATVIMCRVSNLYLQREPPARGPI